MGKEIFYIDYGNREIIINQNNTDSNQVLLADKHKLENLFPEVFGKTESDCITIDLKNNKIVINKDIEKPIINSMLTKDMFIPVEEKYIEGLCEKREYILAALGLEEVNISDIPTETEELIKYLYL